jgi:hypothetical protein
MKQLLSMTTALGLSVLLGYKPIDRHPLIVRFHNTAGGRPLELFTGIYANSFGEPFSVEQFKYYVTRIRVTDRDGREEVIAADVHLVDQSDTGSLTLRLLCGLNRLQSIAFVVGVDSVANTGGVMTGDLDPLRGMFWTWNSGYIYARLEGQSDSAKAPAHRWSWDIGGYKANVNAAREVVLCIPDPRQLKGAQGQADQWTQGRPAEAVLTIGADLLKWFDGKTAVRLSASPTCHEPGALAMRIADNYSTMFSIVH